MRGLEATGELFAGNSIDATASETQPVKIGQICTFLNWCVLYCKFGLVISNSIQEFVVPAIITFVIFHERAYTDLAKMHTLFRQPFDPANLCQGTRHNAPTLLLLPVARIRAYVLQR